MRIFQISPSAGLHLLTPIFKPVVQP